MGSGVRGREGKGWEGEGVWGGERKKGIGRGRGVAGGMVEASLMLVISQAKGATSTALHKQHTQALLGYVHSAARGAIHGDQLHLVEQQRSVVVAFAKIDGLEASLLAG